MDRGASCPPARSVSKETGLLCAEPSLSPAAPPGVTLPLALWRRSVLSSFVLAGGDVVLVVGVNGTGKTTTIAKLGRRYAEQGLKVGFVAGDTFRAAAVEQLQVWAGRTSARFFAPTKPGADAAGLAFDALTAARTDGLDLLLVDTAGRLHNKSALMEELRKIIRVIKRVDEAAPHSVLLVLDATTGQNAV